MLLNGHKAPTVHRPLLAARVLSRLKARADADSSFWLNTLPSGHQAAVNRFHRFRSRPWGANIPLQKVFLPTTQAALKCNRRAGENPLLLIDGKTLKTAAELAVKW